MDKTYFLFPHPGWVGLNTSTKIINEFPPFSSYQCLNGLKITLFGATSLTMIKIYPEVIGSSRKRYDMLPFLFPSIFYYHILPLLILWKNSEIAILTLWHPGYGDFFSICGPILTWPNQVSNLFGVGRGTQIYKKWTSNGGKNWG